jgi:hypothetical protein
VNREKPIPFESAAEGTGSGGIVGQGPLGCARAQADEAHWNVAPRRATVPLSSVFRVRGARGNPGPASLGLPGVAQFDSAVPSAGVRSAKAKHGAKTDSEQVV